MKHNWHLLIQCPILTIDDGQGMPVVIVDPGDRAEAEENAVYGCINCDETLDNAYNTDCMGRQV